MRFLLSVRGLAILTMAGLSLTTLLLVALPVVTLVARYTVLDALASHTLTYADLDRVEGTGRYVGWIGEPLPFAAGASFLLFVAWLYRARRDLERRGRTHPRWGWGWTILGWLVPVANLVVPPAVIADVVRESRRPHRWPATALVWLGWLALLGGLGYATYLGTRQAGQVSGFSIIYSYAKLSDPVDPETRVAFTRLAPALPPETVATVLLFALAALAWVAVVGLVTAGLRRRTPTT